MLPDSGRSVFGFWHLVGVVWLGIVLGACQEDEARIQRARDLFERDRFQRAEQTLAPLFETGAGQPDSLCLFYGKVLLARGALHRARDAFERVLDRAPTRRGEGVYGLARTHFYLGHPDTAQTLSRRLLRRGHNQDDPMLVARGHHVIGRTHFYEAQYDRALARQRTSLQWARRAGAPEARANALRQIGVLYWYRGKIDSARTAFYEPALRLYRQVGDSIGVATTLSNIGFLHWQKEEWQAHVRLQLRAFALRKRMGHQVGLADSYSFLSVIPGYTGTDNSTYQIKYARKSLRLSRRIGYAWGEQVASGRVTKALRSGLEDWDRPLPALQTTASQSSGEYRLLRLVRAAQTARRTNQWRRADTLLARVRRISDSIGYHNFQRGPLLQRSRLLLRLGREDEARALLRRADTLEGSGTRPWTNTLATRLRARLALRNGSPARAADLLRPLAEKYDRKYLRTLHQTAPEVAFQTAAEAVHGTRSRIYGRLLDALVGWKEREAFAQLERERRLPFWGGPQSGESEKFGRLVRQLEQLEAHPGRTSEIQDVLTTLGELRSKKLAEQRVLDRAGPTIGDLDVTTRPALRRVLREQEVFAEFFVAKDTMLVFVARTDSSAFLRLPRNRLSKTVETYREIIKRGHEHPRERLWRPTGRRLYELVLQPLVRDGWLTPDDHLIMAPHRMLFGVPVHALPVPTTGDAPRFAVERYGVSYTLSATALVERRHRPGQPLDSVLAAAPVSERLAYTEREVRHVPAAPFEERRVLTGDDARASVVRRRWDQYDIVHLAAHARTKKQFPLYSYLQFSDDRIELHEVLRDRLSAQLVVLSACETGRGVGGSGSTPTSATLVSFPRAVLSAGASSVVASLWRVDDKATARLMKHFYRQLTGPPSSSSSQTQVVSSRSEGAVSPAKALIRAQRRYLSEARTSSAPSSHPFYWAGFFLMGDGR